MGRARRIPSRSKLIPRPRDQRTCAPASPGRGRCGRPRRETAIRHVWCFSCSPSFLSHVVCASITRDFEVEHREISAHLTTDALLDFVLSSPKTVLCQTVSCHGRAATDAHGGLFRVPRRRVFHHAVDDAVESAADCLGCALNRLAAVLTVDDCTRLLWRVPPVVRSHCAMCAVIVQNEPALLHGCLWSLACCLGGSPFCCLWVVLRLLSDRPQPYRYP